MSHSTKKPWKKVTMTIEVNYRDDVTDPESLASALDTLMDTALSTADSLSEYGSPIIGAFVPVGDLDEEK